MCLGKMGVALDHLEGFVPQHLGDLRQRRPVHGQIRGGGVAKIVEADVLDARPLQRQRPGLAHVDGFRGIAAGEKEAAVDAAALALSGGPAPGTWSCRLRISAPG